jgi:hypothetical protein
MLGMVVGYGIHGVQRFLGGFLGFPLPSVVFWEIDIYLPIWESKLPVFSRK